MKPDLLTSIPRKAPSEKGPLFVKAKYLSYQTPYMAIPNQYILPAIPLLLSFFFLSISSSSRRISASAFAPRDGSFPFMVA